MLSLFCHSPKHAHSLLHSLTDTRTLVDSTRTHTRAHHVGYRKPSYPKVCLSNHLGPVRVSKNMGGFFLPWALDLWGSLVLVRALHVAYPLQLLVISPSQGTGLLSAQNSRQRLRYASFSYSLHWVGLLVVTHDNFVPAPQTRKLNRRKNGARYLCVYTYRAYRPTDTVFCLLDCKMISI